MRQPPTRLQLPSFVLPKRLCAFVFLLLLFSVHPFSILRAATVRERSSSPPQQSSSPTVAGIPLEILDKADLRVQWFFADLPLDRADRLVQMFIHRDQLFVLNNLGKLYALDTQTGAINWTRSLSGTPVSAVPVSVFDDHLILLVGNTCYQVRLNNGSVAHQTTFDFDVTTSVARWQDRLFLGARNKRFYCVRLADRVAVWQSVCPAPPLGTVAIDRDRVYFVTRDNTLYVSSAQNRELLWKAHAVDQLTGVFIDRNQCFMPSYDTALYCLEARTGKLLWKFLAGGRLTQLPVLAEEFVYQPIEHGGLVCLNRSDGSVLWQLKGGKSYLTHNGPTTYAVTHDRTLAIMDQPSARRLASFYRHNFSLYAPSPHDPTLLLATAGGDILALRPDRIVAPPATPAAPPPQPSADSENTTNR